MEQSKEDFSNKLEFGEDGEKEVAIFLIKKGINILPLYQFNNDKAPLIISNNRTFTSPDLTCFNHGEVFFVEVKTKKRWSICERTQRIETGCDDRLYREYLSLSKNTNINLILIFNHKNNVPFKFLKEDSNGYFGISIDEKGRYWDGINESNGKIIHEPIYFWEFKQLVRFNLE